MFKLATEEEKREIMNEVKVWFIEAPMAWIFGDFKHSTKSSVAEYIANKKGLSLWPESKQKKEAI